MTEHEIAADSSGAEAGSTERADLSGSTDALSKLARLYELHAHGLIDGLVAAGYPDASDAVRDAFVQAVVHWRRVHRYDDPLVWIRRVAINKARNRARSRRRQSALRDRLGAEEAVAAHEGPDDDVVAAVAALPAQQREVVALFYYSDLPVAQIATVMGIQEGTVKSQLHAARARISDLLGALS